MPDRNPTAAVNGSNFGKSIISKYLRVIYDFRKKKNFAYLEICFIPRSPKTTRNGKNF